VASLTIIAVTLVLAAILGYITDRLRVSPLLGFFIAGVLVKALLSRYDLGFLGVSGELFSDVGYTLLTLGGVLLAFEMGREVGVVGFDPRVVYIVLVEATAIISITLLLSRALGFPILEGLVVAIAFLSSSSVTTYRLTAALELREVRRLALTITTLEDVALLTAISLVTGKPENPLVVLTLSILFAIVAGLVFRALFSALRGREEYEVVLALTLTLAYASITQYFATPYLGAFVAGYLMGRSLGSKVTLDPYASFIALIYMVSVGLLVPGWEEFRVDIIVLLAVLVVTAFVIRALSVFLAALFILRSGYYAVTLAVALTNVSELAPLAVLTAYGGGLVGGDLALALILLPLATIAVSNALYSRARSLALIAGKYVTMELPRLVPESVYEASLKVMVSSAKISGVLVGAALAVLALSYLGLGFLGLGVLILAVVITIKLYRELWVEAAIVGELPGFMARILAVMVAGAVSAYVIHETLRSIGELEGLSWIAVISLYALIAFLVVELIVVVKRHIEKAVVKLRPPL